jgi:hypothetical protein
LIEQGAGPIQIAASFRKVAVQHREVRELAAEESKIDPIGGIEIGRAALECNRISETL